MNNAYENYLKFVKNFSSIHREAASILLGESESITESDGSGPKIMLFSPHPDDECVVGALPLRMLQELNANVLNVAVTLGSNAARKEGRLNELRNACDTLGFKLIVPNDKALDGVNLSVRETDKTNWDKNVEAIADILANELPDAAFFPHDNDYNSTHIGTHYLVMDAIKKIQKSNSSWQPVIFETEFWHMMEKPNLMVALSEEDEAKLIFALSAHTGEVERNPYHVNHPARMLDNVTRGAEVVGGQGGEAPDCNFAMIYRCSKVTNGKVVPIWEGGKMIGVEESLKSIL